MDLVSPTTFWPLKNGLLNTFPTLDEHVQCDVVILGGGITGAMIGDRFAQAGLHVTILDKREVASGSTSASTALLQYEIDTPLTSLIERMGKSDAERAYQVCLKSIYQIQKLCESLEDDCGFQLKPSLYFASRSRDVKALRKEFEARVEAGFEVEFWEKKEIESHYSFSKPAAIFSRDGAEVDAFRFAHHLLARAKKHGAKIYDRTEVVAYEASSDHVLVRTKEGFSVRARHAVFATGYEMVKLLKRKIVNLNSSFAVVSEPMEEFDGWYEKSLIWETARPYIYARTTSDGRALVGGQDARYRNPMLRDARVERNAEILVRRFEEMFPRIKFQAAYAWAGTFGETVDGLPYIGGVPELPSCYFAAGFGGNGITYSEASANIILDLLQGRYNDDARIFGFDRH